MAEVLDRIEGIVPEKSYPLVASRPTYYPYACLAVLTLACLLPFSGRAFHVDDTLFVMCARQIVHHPLDPYGFSVVWNDTVERMSDVTQNPPLAGYYGALVGITAGWSERAFHLAFLIPALALVLGTYRLAKHFTRFPLLAAMATFLTPGVLVSSTSVMCDTIMTAMWVWAVVLWIEGLQPRKPLYLLGAATLMAAAPLTKYFGVALIPLLAAYSLVRLRRLGSWLWYFVIPVAAVIGYVLWTRSLYGHNLLFRAVHYANDARAEESWVSVWTGLSFTGGCALSVLTLAPLMWSRKAAAIVGAIGALASWALIFGFTKDFGGRIAGDLAFQALRAHWVLVGSQLTLFIAGGLLALGLTITDLWERRNLQSLLLMVWVIGTFVFASFLNWTVNARSVLPMIPAIGILIARRLEMGSAWSPKFKLQIAIALLVSGAVSLWVAAGDMRLADSERDAAYQIQRQTSNYRGTVWYRGHWGFQYYMDQTGAVCMDPHDYHLHPGDEVILADRWLDPVQKDGGLHLPNDLALQNESNLVFPNSSMAATMSWELGAGFYSSTTGPLPFTLGRVPMESFSVLKVNPLVSPATEQTSGHSSRAAP